MVEASQTLLPTGEILAIVVVGVLCTAFLVSAPLLIGEGLQRRANRLAAEAAQTGELGAGEVGEAAALGAGTGETGAAETAIPAQRGEPAAEAPTEPIPATEGPRPAMPAQRSGDYDQAEPSLAGGVPPEEGETRRE